ncbi:15 kDa selenoprotein [Penaeus vannamei]|uniref:15 kDa selenoprotein n=1 Tax=Penaeus vannamei TaxID=6689 RepID=A0A3R7MCW8_PENVA|nr:15 kDa selenoprotein [Penaeus vannamei]
MASRPSANQRAVRVLTAGGGTTTQPSRPHHDGRPRRDRPLYSGHAVVHSGGSAGAVHRGMLAVGLNKANLLCSSCDTLKEFNLDVLEANCRGCCNVDDVNATPTKYPRAILEVCG